MTDKFCRGFYSCGLGTAVKVRPTEKITGATAGHGKRPHMAFVTLLESSEWSPTHRCIQGQEAIQEVVNGWLTEWPTPDFDNRL